MKNQEVLDKLVNELNKAEVKKDILIQDYIDSVESLKLKTIELIYNQTALKIKALNKRIVLLQRYIHV